MEPRGVFLGGANFSRLPSRLDPVTLFSVGSCQRPKSFLLNSSRFAKKQNSLSGAGRRACVRQQPGCRDLRAAVRGGACVWVPRLGPPPMLAVLLRVGFCLGAVSIDTALPVSRLPLPRLGIMPSEHHVPLQPLNRCTFPCLKCGGEQSILHPVTERVVPTPPG